MSRKGITCRFRKSLDADLITATTNLGNGELSELTRNGLRLMLGIRTTRQMEVKEKPLFIPGMQQGIRVIVPPALEQKEKTAQPQQKPAAVLFTNMRD